MNWIDWVGYLGAALVVISFLVSSNVRIIRFINMLGAFAYIAYGILLDMNIPVIIPNIFIVCIQLYYLYFKKEKKEQSA